VAEAALPVAQALIRWDPVTHAERELAERETLGFPPAVRMAAVTGAAATVTKFLAETVLPAAAEVIGTVPAGEDKVRALIRIPRREGLALAAALRDAQAARTARKDTGQVRIQVDPADLI
jgi:primosomal protein N' (replication factor Y)